MLQAVLNKSWKQHPIKNSFTAAYISSYKPLELDETIYGTTRKANTNAFFPIVSYKWMCNGFLLLQDTAK